MIRGPARPGPLHNRAMNRRRGRDRDRDAVPRRGRGDRSVTLRASFHPRHQARPGDHAGDRPESCPEWRRDLNWGRFFGVGNLDARTRQQLTDVHALAELERRQALHGENLREGFRRLLGSGRQERRRGERQLGQMRFRQFVSRARVQRRRPRSPDHDRHRTFRLQMDQVTMLYVPASSSMNCGYGRTTTWFGDRRRYFDFGRSQYSIHYVPMARSVSASRPRTLRATCSRTNGRPTVRDLIARYRPSGRCDREHRRGSETSTSASAGLDRRCVERGVGPARRAELPTEISLYLRHASARFRP